MKFDELNEDQKMCAKQDFLLRLADKGRFVKVVYGPGNGAERDPFWKELAEADRLVPDDMMRREGVDYVPDDFSPVTDHYDQRHPSRWEEIEVRLRHVLNYTEFIKVNPEYRCLNDNPGGKIIGKIFEWIDLTLTCEFDRVRKIRANEVKGDH